MSPVSTPPVTGSPSGYAVAPGFGAGSGAGFNPGFAPGPGILLASAFRCSTTS
jgi:hypothetical protein